MCICDNCRRSFPEEMLYAYSPGGLVKIHECPECHDRGSNAVDLRINVRSRAIRAELRERVS